MRILIGICLFTWSTFSFGLSADTLEIKRLTEKVIEYRYSKYLDSARFYFKKALPIAVKANDSVLLFRLHKLMGDAYEHHQKLDSTLFVYGLCEQLIPAGNNKLRAFLLGDKAYTYRLLYDYEKSTELNMQALQLAELDKNNRQIATSALNVAEDLAFLSMHTEARSNYDRAIAAATEDRDTVMLSYCYRYYGQYLLKVNQHAEAYVNLKQAEKISAALHDSISLAYTWFHLSEYYWLEKKSDSCFRYAKIAESIWENRAEYIDLANICLQTGGYYLELGNLLLAEFYLKKAEHYMLGDIYFNERLLSQIAELYFRKNNIAKAYEYLSRAKKMNKEISDKELTSKLAGLRLKYEADKKEAQLQEEKTETYRAQQSALESKYQRNIILLVLIFALAVSLLLWFMYGKVRQKNLLLVEANEALSESTAQKQILLKEIHHRVKNNLTTLKSLFYLQAKSSANSEVKMALEESQLRLQSMALIHQNMYQEAENEKIQFLDFLKQMMNNLEISVKSPDKDIKVSFEGQGVALDMSTALFLGLMVNELATNAYKYAFADKNNGSIEVKLKAYGKHTIILFSDDGPGLPHGTTLATGGFGFKLLSIMTQQIQGSLEYFREGHKTVFKIELPNGN